MGELNRKARGQEPPAPPEMVTVTMTMSKAAWARLQLKADMEAGQSRVARAFHEAVQGAVVVPAGTGPRTIVVRPGEVVTLPAGEPYCIEVPVHPAEAPEEGESMPSDAGEEG